MLTELSCWGVRSQMRVNEAEIALASRYLSWPAAITRATRATLEAHAGYWESGQHPTIRCRRVLPESWRRADFKVSITPVDVLMPKNDN